MVPHEEGDRRLFVYIANDNIKRMLGMVLLNNQVSTTFMHIKLSTICLLLALTKEDNYVLIVI